MGVGGVGGGGYRGEEEGGGERTLICAPTVDVAFYAWGVGGGGGGYGGEEEGGGEGTLICAPTVDFGTVKPPQKQSTGPYHGPTNRLTRERQKQQDKLGLLAALRVTLGGGGGGMDGEGS